MHALETAIPSLMRQAAEDFILPRFRKLEAGETEEKTPGDLVTIADRESEIFLTEALLKLLPGSRVMGEEAESAHPGAFRDPGDGAVWTVDPLDGTNNFAAGTSPFAVMVGLTVDGESEAGWIYDPLSRRLCHALRGKGAFVDGTRVAAQPSGAPLPIAAISTIFLKPEERAEMERRTAGRLTLVPIPRCAGEQYPRIVSGANDIAVFKRTHAWDHIPGTLFLQEAGGHVARLDGTCYRIDRPGTGMLCASSRPIWDRAAEILFR